jgi:hypothetical protein
MYSCCDYLHICFCSKQEGEKRGAHGRISETQNCRRRSKGSKFKKRIRSPYEIILNWVKRADYAIDSADIETGQIITAMTVTSAAKLAPVSCSH